jgi:hypothetical protein
MSTMTESSVCPLAIHQQLVVLTLIAEALLIDFCEIVGGHSGGNMVEEVRSTLDMYGLNDSDGVTITSDSDDDDLPDLIPAWVITISMDNVFNNDTVLKPVSEKKRLTQYYRVIAGNLINESAL